MALMTLEGMRFYAFHGYYEAEQRIGGEYEVDITIKMGINKTAKEDDLALTINYETVYQVCRIEMEKPCKLLETVVMNIIEHLKQQFSTIQGLRIRVRKLHPPLGGRVAAAWIEEEADYVATCPRCNKKFINYGDEECWKQANLHPATKETLQRQYGGKCLCPDCLKLFAG